jgi:hypothetical protein
LFLKKIIKENNSPKGMLTTTGLLEATKTTYLGHLHMSIFLSLAAQLYGCHEWGWEMGFVNLQKDYGYKILKIMRKKKRIIIIN